MIISSSTPLSPQPTSMVFTTMTPAVTSFLAIRSNNKVHIVDSNFTQVSEFPETSQYYYLDKCVLQGITFFDSSIQLLVEDFTGHTISSQSIDFIKPQNAHLLVPSPDKKWFVYRVASGMEQRSLDDSTLQDLEVFNVDSPKKTIRLTENSGAWPGKFLWSNDNLHIAFTDYDQNNIHQIYIFNLNDKTKINITNFGQEMIGKLITRFTWSSDFSKIVFSIANTQNEQGELFWFDEKVGIVSLTGENIYWVNLGNNERGIKNIWWEESGILITSETHNEPEITWLNPLSLQMKTYKLSQFFDNSNKYYNIIPASDKISDIFVIGENVFLFDVDTLSQHLITDDTVFQSRYELITSPNGWHWIDNCSYPNK